MGVLGFVVGLASPQQTRVHRSSLHRILVHRYNFLYFETPSIRSALFGFESIRSDSFSDWGISTIRCVHLYDNDCDQFDFEG